MTVIRLNTTIKASIQETFDLSRNIDFHQKSASQTQEQAIDGITSGLIGLDETVTWRGKHFGMWLTHKSLISAFTSPAYFVDEMVAGHFKSFRHEHYFEQREDVTVMKDVLSYKTPYGVLGIFFNKLILKKHLILFLETRNHYLKNHLEKS